MKHTTESGNSGWIMLHRKAMDSYYREEFCRNMAWIDLLLLANHDDNTFFIRGRKIIVNRGQLAYAQETLAIRWGWSRGKVDRFLTFLQEQERIVQQKNNATTLITILNYNDYQSFNTTGKQRTNTGRTPNEHRTDTNNNDNNVNNVNNDNKTCKQLNVSFEDFWTLYDKKVGTPEKLQAKWAKLKDSERTEIMEYLPRYKQAQPDKKFRKNPDTFFNQRGWEHEIVGEAVSGVVNHYQSDLEKRRAEYKIQGN